MWRLPRLVADVRAAVFAASTAANSAAAAAADAAAAGRGKGGAGSRRGAAAGGGEGTSGEAAKVGDEAGEEEEEGHDGLAAAGEKAAGKAHGKRVDRRRRSFAYVVDPDHDVREAVQVEWRRGGTPRMLPSPPPARVTSSWPWPLVQGVAYKVSNGPWVGCWVRLGYSPQADPAARILQVVDLR